MIMLPQPRISINVGEMDSCSVLYCTLGFQKKFQSRPLTKILKKKRLKISLWHSVYGNTKFLFFSIIHLQVAEEAGIDQLLDPEDTVEVQDTKSIILYLSTYEFITSYFIELRLIFV
jgi:hypothetical protein